VNELIISTFLLVELELGQNYIIVKINKLMFKFIVRNNEKFTKIPIFMSKMNHIIPILNKYDDYVTNFPYKLLSDIVEEDLMSYSNESCLYTRRGLA